VPLIVGMARALEIGCEDLESEAKRQRELRERMRSRLVEALPGTTLNGHPDERLPGNLSLTFDGVDADRLLLSLSDVAISSGSACSTANPAPSHVLLAIGLSERQAKASIRVGIGRGTTQDEIDAAADRMIEEIRAQSFSQGG
jgi:cysteine desulfurase